MTSKALSNSLKLGMKRDFLLVTTSNSNQRHESNLPSVPVKSFEEDTQVTHTGQKFERDDRRLVRFIHSTKIVNKNHAIDLIAAVPPIPSADRIVYCDGGGPLGHPKVYINLDKPGNHTCGYCGLRFYKEDHHH